MDNEILKLLMSEFWPPAAPDKLICNPQSQQDKLDRARVIGEMLTFYFPNIAEFKVLEIGCGEGHLINNLKAKTCIGYDIENTFASEGNGILTINKEEVIAHAPYDLIVLYDVLDHAEDPVELLTFARTVSITTTRAFVRCHPWLARHGGHQYHTLNKAYTHLILTDEELESVGLNKIPNSKKIIDPTTCYKQWFEDSGWIVEDLQIVKDEVEQFFTKHPVLSRIKRHSWPKKSYVRMLQGSFYDYIIRYYS